MKNYKVKLLAKGLSLLFGFLSHIVHMKAIKYPEIEQMIFALWHSDQTALFNVKNPNRLNVLISKSNDGEIIAAATESLGIRTVRGSQGRKGAEATLKLIEKLEQGENIAITVDGPKGPPKKVKKGIINIAKLSQVPIVPMCFDSKSRLFLRFNSWDGFKIPVGPTPVLVLYGEPIYVPSDCDEDGIEFYRKKLEDALLALELELQENFDEYFNL